MSYPVTLKLSNKRVLVVGGGRVATRRVEALLAADAAVTVVSPAVLKALWAWAEAGRVQWHARGYQSADLDGMALVLAATDQPLLNQQVMAEARQRGLWVNGAHEGAESDFTLPAVAHQEPLTLAVETGGASPALARALRDHLQTTLHPGWVAALRLFRTLRPSVLRVGNEARRHQFWQALLREVPEGMERPTPELVAWVVAAARESHLPLDEAQLTALLHRILEAERGDPAKEGGDSGG